MESTSIGANVGVAQGDRQERRIRDLVATTWHSLYHKIAVIVLQRSKICSQARDYETMSGHGTGRGREVVCAADE